MIQDYYQLTCRMTYDYIGACHGKHIEKHQDSGDKLTQINVYENPNSFLLIANIIKLTVKKLVVCLYYHDDSTRSILIDWGLLVPERDIKFPIDEITLSADLIKKFNDAVESEVRKDHLKQLFSRPLEESHESLGAKGESLGAKGESRGVGGDRSFPNFDVADSSKTIISDKPGFEDEYEMRRPASSGMNHFDPPGIGDDDLYPGGIKNPTVGGFPDPLRAGPAEGMYPSSLHPLFGRTNRPGHAPPGARYDDPLGDPDDMDMIGDGLPGYKGPSGGVGRFGNDFGGFGGHFGL